MAVYNVRKTQSATISLRHTRENNTDLLDRTLDRITYGYFRFYFRDISNVSLSQTVLYAWLVATEILWMCDIKKLKPFF